MKTNRQPYVVTRVYLERAPRPYKHLIPQPKHGMFTAPYPRTRGAFGGKKTAKAHRKFYVA